MRTLTFAIGLLALVSLFSSQSALAVNGFITEQNLTDGQGYTVLCVYGSHYQMGYAQGYLLADWILLAYQQFSTTFGTYWALARQRVSGWTFLPPECEDEFAGMLDGVRAIHPEAPLDVLDLKVASTMGDWLYSAACRSTCCWNDLVASPYTTLAMRKLQFMQFPPQITQQWHHVICAWQPNDGPYWVNFGFPGYVACVTGINEHGTLASLHDWNSSAGTNYPDALPRTMACRHVLTMDLGYDPSTHLQAAYEAIHPYHAATGGFLNYYVPDGGAGVIKHSKNHGYYEVRVPQPEWMDGHVIDTNNSDIDGRSGVEPWDVYYETLDPDHGALATMDGLWATGYQATDMHMVAAGIRDWCDLTIWFEGRLQSGTTGRLEFEWTNLQPDIDNVGEDSPPIGRPATYLVSPNPAFGSAGREITVMAFRDPSAKIASPPARILDLAGRFVRELPACGAVRAGRSVPGQIWSGESRPDEHDRLVYRWDGLDALGQPARSGVYWVTIPGAEPSGRIVWLGR